MTAQQLKNAILQMAVQGKLVPQDPNDEPASVLLERIRAEKQALIKAGKIKKTKETPIASEEVPFEIPESWEWARVKKLTELYNGKAFKPSDWSERGLPIVRIQNLNNANSPYNYYDKPVEEDYRLYGGELLFAWSGTPGTSFGAHIWKKTDAVLNQHIFKLKFNEEYLYKKYFMYALNQRVLTLIGLAHGSSGLQHVTKGVFESTLIPIPPLAEQKRIVAKIEELLPFIAQYERAESELSALNASFPEMLKKAILQEAVQGRLVPQDPNDEPASVLLERIRAEKQALVKAGKIKKEKPLASITEDEIPFEIPESWEWSSINELFFVTKLAGFEYTKYFKKDNIHANNPVHIVRAKNVKMGQFIENEDEAITDDLSVLLNRSALTKDCLLMTFIGAGIGDTCLYHSDKRHHLAPNVAKIEPQTSGILLQYYLIWLMSPEGQKSIEKIKKSTAQSSLSMETIRSIRVAVPPFAEQNRIVAKIEEIMPIISTI